MDCDAVMLMPSLPATSTPLDCQVSRRVSWMPAGGIGGEKQRGTRSRSAASTPSTAECGGTRGTPGVSTTGLVTGVPASTTGGGAWVLVLLLWWLLCVVTRGPVVLF